MDAPVSSDVAFGGQALCAPGFVPYYRSPEECLRTSPGPPACPLWGQESTGKLPGPGAASLRRSRCWGRQGPLKNGPRHLMISTQAVKWLAVRLPELSSPWTWSWPGTAAFRPSFSLPAGGPQAPAGSPVGLERRPCTLLASGSTEGRAQPVPYLQPHPQEVTLPPRLLPLIYPSWETCPVESSCPKSASTKQKGQGWLDTWEAQRPETSL